MIALDFYVVKDHEYIMVFFEMAMRKDETMITFKDENTLYDGEKEEIEKIVCYECGNKLLYSYEDGTFTISCKQCKNIIKYSKSPMPNCIKFNVS